eukprot:TRINITY_DN448_c0_g1_i2.p1 TRINITY_DN448_c0_g1~~TRINITY_DN448_c0_g1_i2.p1  ORF type:complete len:752 (+),score=184.63 TRINITY_DN448_c0_g1_i2:47-2302(+)
MCIRDRKEAQQERSIQQQNDTSASVEEEEEEEDGDSNNLWNSEEFIQWKNIQLEKLLVTTKAFADLTEKHLGGEGPLFKEVKSMAQLLAQDLYELDKQSRSELHKAEKRNQVSDETLLRSPKLVDLVSSWRQYLTFMEKLKHTPKIEELLDVSNLQDFVEFYAKNNHPTEAQGRSSASVFNRLIYLRQVLRFIKSQPRLFPQKLRDLAEESWYYLKDQAANYKKKKEHESKENKSLPVQRLELSDLNMEERAWLVDWLCAEVDTVAKWLEEGHPLSYEQAVAFQYWFLVLAFLFLGCRRQLLEDSDCKHFATQIIDGVEIFVRFLTTAEKSGGRNDLPYLPIYGDIMWTIITIQKNYVVPVLLKAANKTCSMEEAPLLINTKGERLVGADITAKVKTVFIFGMGKKCAPQVVRRNVTSTLAELHVSLDSTAYQYFLNHSTEVAQEWYNFKDKVSGIVELQKIMQEEVHPNLPKRRNLAIQQAQVPPLTSANPIVSFHSDAIRGNQERASKLAALLEEWKSDGTWDFNAILPRDAFKNASQSHFRQAADFTLLVVKHSGNAVALTNSIQSTLTVQKKTVEWLEETTKVILTPKTPTPKAAKSVPTPKTAKSVPTPKTAKSVPTPKSTTEPTTTTSSLDASSPNLATTGGSHFYHPCIVPNNSRVGQRLVPLNKMSPSKRAVVTDPKGASIKPDLLSREEFEARQAAEDQKAKQSKSLSSKQKEEDSCDSVHTAKRSKEDDESQTKISQFLFK